MCCWSSGLEVKVRTRPPRRRLSMRSMIQTWTSSPSRWSKRSAYPSKITCPAFESRAYVLALFDRCRNGREPQLATEALQTRQLFRRSTSLNASDVGIRQSHHVHLPLFLVCPAVPRPAIFHGKLIKIVHEGGSPVWYKSWETIEIGLLCHGDNW